jgi:hypothetical protein
MWELLELILNGLMLFGNLTDEDPKKRRSAWIGCGITVGIILIGIVLYIIVTVIPP